MKNHANIPIFLPHKGCPNDCVFCNQKVITAKLNPLSKDEVINIIETYLSTLLVNNTKTIEIAFFGGSFTGIPIEEQKEYLKIAKDYMNRGLVHRIRLSTRPDYINEEILEHLKFFGVSTIELGVQSFDDNVLKLSNRGHNSQCIYQSSELIKQNGFDLGIQLMIGLPGDSRRKSVESAKKTVKIGPKDVRIYPTMVLPGTKLEEMYHKGEYNPLIIEEAIETTKQMYLIFKTAGINIIRVGLKSTDYIGKGKNVVAGDYHPAFRQLVEGDLIKDILEDQLKGAFKKAVFYCNNSNLSTMVGNRKCNKIYFEKKYPNKLFEFRTDNQLGKDEFRVELV